MVGPRSSRLPADSLGLARCEGELAASRVTGASTVARTSPPIGWGAPAFRR